MHGSNRCSSLIKPVNLNSFHSVPPFLVPFRANFLQYILKNNSLWNDKVLILEFRISLNDNLQSEIRTRGAS